MKLLALFALALFLAAWKLPSAPQNYPTEGTAAAWIASEACTPEKTAGCIGFSGLTPMWIYAVGAVPNPHFIFLYARFLKEDCKTIPETCPYLETQLQWFRDNGVSPHRGLTVWPVWNGHANAMVQANLAEFLMDTDPDLAERAGRAFDWTAGNGGVAYVYELYRYWYLAANVGTDNHLFILNQMNYAVIGLQRLCASYGEPWCQRAGRGMNALNAVGKRSVAVDDFDAGGWSYYRAAPLSLARCWYHGVNAETSAELGLEPFASRWTQTWRETC